MSAQQLSRDVEQMLVRQNLRGMKDMLPYTKSGAYGRAAALIAKTSGLVLIGTGFPVANCFETDGPLGAIVLYRLIEKLGTTAVLACGEPLYSALKADYSCVLLPRHSEASVLFAQQSLQQLSPSLIISIESPGLAADGRYYNMRGQDISERSANFDVFFQWARCPTIAIGDGGNEIGMGNICQALSSLAIMPAVTRCDELLLADVSNWAAYALVALVAKLKPSAEAQGWLLQCQPAELLQFLHHRGAVDGVTGLATMTEDSLPVEHALELINDLQQLCFKR